MNAQVQSKFDGADVQVSDDPRLQTQLDVIRDLLLLGIYPKSWKYSRELHNGGWWSLYSISVVTRFGGASISAQLRNLRKPRFGGYTVERRRVSAGYYEYRVLR